MSLKMSHLMYRNFSKMYIIRFHLCSKLLFLYISFPGHRAHTVFVGVHVPGGRRHSHRRHKRRENGEKQPPDSDRPSKYIRSNVFRISSKALHNLISYLNVKNLSCCV
jgi:hypothetical protein